MGGIHFALSSASHFVRSFDLMRLCAAAAAMLGFAALAVTPATADVRVNINKASQSMHVYVDGSLAYVWPVSTGRKGYGTPSGSYRAQRLERYWYSRKYDNAPMHNAVFFRGGYAIHGTSYVSQLGSPASHGCVRLHPSNAAELYALVQQHGRGNTRISLR
jgi:lipoprotein-anchoring transpeptidase ErfK/SrfK